MIKISDKDEAALRAICADWHERAVKRASLPPKTTIGEMMARIDLCERVITELDGRQEAPVPTSE